MNPLSEGLYEAVVTTSLDRMLSSDTRWRPEFADVGAPEAPGVLARHVASLVQRVVVAEKDDARRVALVNELIALLDLPDDAVLPALRELTRLGRADSPQTPTIRPLTAFHDAALLTNARNEPSLSAELRAEIASADRIDLLCAFIKWHGLRVLEEPLSQAHGRGVPIRVITTTYVGSTERRAVDELVRRFGATVKITYELDSTRLHAKAWLFRRNSGYDTAFVGSSNLSKSAIVDGLEWNVRISGVATPDLIRKWEGSFDSYWADPSFVTYDPDVNGDDLDDALNKAANRDAGGALVISLSGLELRPYPHQEQVLEALATEREVHGRHRNLVVAATGTGKTVMAALDYRRLIRDADERGLSLLFVAHRSEILTQSLRTYREALADGDFGELYVSGARPERWRHVFASIQSLGAYGLDRIAPDHFDVVVVDEFHHAAAASYRRLLEHLRPRELLGLTATPERSDGLDVRTYFGDRIAYELRLWDALAADLLVPFHYFGLADDVDLTSIEWKRGAYDVEGLERLYTGNDARAAKILRELRDKVTDVTNMRALGFCVSVAHAEYMARVFREAGVPALAVSGETSPSARADAISRLRRREVNALFAADLFNEGLDVPEMDTVLFLRPTQSATIFLQQLGRGLRRTHGKAVLTVLDFIGRARREFRFDVRYRALTGTSRRELEHQAEQGFPFLPSGSQIVLDRVAQSIVLDNIRTQLRVTRKQLVADVRSHGDLSLADYLREANRDLAEVYGKHGSWTSLRREAGLPTPAAGPDEDKLLRRVSALSHVDDEERAELYACLADQHGPAYQELTAREQALARMLFFTIWPNAGGFSSYESGLAHLRSHPAVCAELREVAALGLDRTRHLARPLGEGLQHVPLQTHAQYRREEILAGLGWASMTRSARGNITGVAWAEETNTDALMINLRKTERDFSPTTMYRDFAISPDLFHWESQNATSTTSAAGRRYLHHASEGSHVVLFVRDTPENDIGAAPFLCLGPASYVEHRGERPIGITWKLHRSMPADTFRSAAVVAS